MTIAQNQQPPSATPDSEVWQKLTEKGESQGYVTYDDILALLPAVEHNIDLLEELLEALATAGLEVLPSPLPRHRKKATRRSLKSRRRCVLGI